jgi:hypothetical protein
MSARTSLRTAWILVGLATGTLGAMASVAPVALAAGPAKAAISEDASAAVAQMGRTLQADQF